MSLRLPNSGSGSAAAAFKIATRALCVTEGNFDRNACNLANFLGGSAIACSPSASTDQDVLERSGLLMGGEIHRTRKIESKLIWAALQSGAGDIDVV